MADTIYWEVKFKYKDIEKHEFEVLVLASVNITEALDYAKIRIQERLKSWDIKSEFEITSIKKTDLWYI